MNIRNRELSQFGSFVYIDDATKTVGIATTATPYVGIGTTNATAKLTVIGDTNVSGIISATGYYLNGNELVDAAIQTWEINGSNIYRSSGNVGIGSSIPGSKLTVAGDITATGAITGSNVSVGGITGSNVSVGGITTASRFVSTVASGTAPLTVNSTTQISNLNASLLAGKSPPAGDIVGTSDSQTLTNKTLTSPIISSIVNGAFTLNIPSVNGTLVSTGSTGTVTSNMIADLNIVNADVATNAGITYGKLSLSNSITNADIVTGAGITYGKLSLSNSITNADIVTGAGISVSKLSASTISGITLGNNLETLSFGTYLTGTSYNGSTSVMIATNATSANTTSTIVARDGSGNFTAGTITASNFTSTGDLSIRNINSTGIITCANFTSTGDLSIRNINSTGIITCANFTSTGDLSIRNINSTGIITCTDLNSTSDINLKENIKTVDNALETISALRGVSFDWKNTGKSSIGVIAQELERVLPELVTDGDPKTVNYNGLIGVLIEAVKELSEEVHELKAQLNN
jgi:hypothetical protein